MAMREFRGTDYDPPVGWSTLAGEPQVTRLEKQELNWQGDDETLEKLTAEMLSQVVCNSIVTDWLYYAPGRVAWWHTILPVRRLDYAIRQLDAFFYDPSVFVVFAQVFIKALGAQKGDCRRPLKGRERHDMGFFTNYRTVQIHCCHTPAEACALEFLKFLDQDFHDRQINHKIDGQNYCQVLDLRFDEARKSLAWECVISEGIDIEQIAIPGVDLDAIDMAALSARDANVDILSKQAVMKVKPVPPPKAPGKISQKEKDHPPPPPNNVLEPPSADRRKGATYQTGKCLGKGGFAICYEAQLYGSKKVYALKIVKSHMPQKKMEQKFQTELQIHSKMDHANIVKFHRAFSFQQCTYIVLELCPNGSLMDMVKKRKFITEPEVRYWTIQMAGAIKYMHAKGIIHRDLKMGNIFLDKNMNVKVGDFGLAALLMSNGEMNNVRRTTLCGTPNYIAPEILEKGKGGHDHMVDIWSLGIIIFAMLTGKPPFQSTTADEIYRRAREREYDWPKLDTSENFISEETKELVSTLLQGPDQRPDPDTIVQHPFFTCGWMPQSEEMTPELRDQQPHPTQFLSAGIRNGRGNLYSKNLKKLCIQCEVGPWTAPMKYKSTYREVAAEEKAHLTPIVPLAEGVVYRPFHQWQQEQLALQNETQESEGSSEEYRDFSTMSIPKSTHQPPPSLPRLPSIRIPTQSFAAQQRSRPGPPSSSQSSRSLIPAQTSLESRQGGRSSTESSSRPLVTLPKKLPKHEAPKVEEKVEGRIESATPIFDVEKRLAADMAYQMNKAEVERKSQESAPPTVFTKTVSIFSPREQLEEMPETTSTALYDGIRRFVNELDRALKSRTLALESNSFRPATPAMVVKWVDYSNKYGLGYILSNGSVGTIFKGKPDSRSSSSYIPPTSLVVRNGEQHLLNRGNTSYMDRFQVVPISGPHIEFYEIRGAGGLVRGRVNPQHFAVPSPVDGKIGSLAPGSDLWDIRKKEMIVLWRKFSNYMVSYSRDYDFPYDEAISRVTPPKSSDRVGGDAVIFWQRIGDVACWVFGDGHYQFNFPDHTKIILSADGTWCDFYHLSLESARDLAANGTLPSSALDDRGHLSYPTQTLLNFMAKPGKSLTRKRPDIDPMIQGIPEANEFRKKIEFIKSVVKEWAINDGIGNCDRSPTGRLRWTGARETKNITIPYKVVWGTIGAKGGDERVSAWFDPRNPYATLTDIIQ